MVGGLLAHPAGKWRKAFDLSCRMRCLRRRGSVTVTVTGRRFPRCSRPNTARVLSPPRRNHHRDKCCACRNTERNHTHRSCSSLFHFLCARERMIIEHTMESVNKAACSLSVLCSRRSKLRPASPSGEPATAPRASHHTSHAVRVDLKP
jgi:hypothetical protein